MKPEMNLIIKLPPKPERDKLINAWVQDVMDGNGYESIRSAIQVLMESGYHHNGINCMILHRQTARELASKIREQRSGRFIDIAFSEPFGLN